MSEILLTEVAKHYLLAGNSLGETATVTVSNTEVNVIIRYAIPGQAVESNVVAQVTTVDNQNYAILLKQIHSVSDVENTSDGKQLALKFLGNLDDYLQVVERRRAAENEPISKPLLHLRHGLKDLLDQLA